jgi:hypothetical protein
MISIFANNPWNNPWKLLASGRPVSHHSTDSRMAIVIASVREAIQG